MARVLIVDDEKSIRVTLSEFLRDAGHAVLTAENARDALQILAERDLDVVVTDIILPRIDGIELMNRIRTVSPPVKIIMITGEPTLKTASDAVRAGAFDYLAKPVYQDAICKVVAAAAALKELEDAKRRLEEENLRYQEHLEDLVRKRTFQVYQREAYYRALIDHAPDMILVLDREGRIIDVSPSFTRILGYQESDLLDRMCDVFVHPDDWPRVNEALSDLLHTPANPVTLLYRGRHNDGTWRMLEATANNLLDNPDVNGIVVNTRDITERRKAEEEKAHLEAQLAQSMKMEAIGRLAGGLAHDFNNLLTSIQGNTEMIEQSLKEGDPLLEDLEEIKKASDRASALTQQLLAFSRKQPVEPKVVNLNELIANSEKMIGRLVGEDVDLVVKPGPEIGNIKADPHQIDQILLNLTVNARDAMPEGGTLVIETAQMEVDSESTRMMHELTPQSYVVLSVSDSGIGMDAETKKHIFEPFFTTKELGKGTGLGLSTVYGIVMQNNGAISVYSEENLGTTFKIYLPVVTETEPVKKRKKKKTELAGGNETILLVEDEELVLNLAKKILLRSGYNVLDSVSPGDAYFLLEKYKGEIHLLLTDVIMPNINGRELYEKLLTLKPDLKVLFMSGYSEEIIAHHGFIDQDTHFIRKPFSIKELANKVRDVLDM